MTSRSSFQSPTTVLPRLSSYSHPSPSKHPQLQRQRQGYYYQHQNLPTPTVSYSPEYRAPPLGFGTTRREYYPVYVEQELLTSWPDVPLPRQPQYKDQSTQTDPISFEDLYSQFMVYQAQQEREQERRQEQQMVESTTPGTSGKTSGSSIISNPESVDAAALIEMAILEEWADIDFDLLLGCQGSVDTVLDPFPYGLGPADGQFGVPLTSTLNLVGDNEKGSHFGELENVSTGYQTDRERERASLAELGYPTSQIEVTDCSEEMPSDSSWTNPSITSLPEMRTFDAYQSGYLDLSMEDPLSSQQGYTQISAPMIPALLPPQYSSPMPLPMPISTPNGAKSETLSPPPPIEDHGGAGSMSVSLRRYEQPPGAGYQLPRGVLADDAAMQHASLAESVKKNKRQPRAPKVPKVQVKIKEKAPPKVKKDKISRRVVKAK